MYVYIIIEVLLLDEGQNSNWDLFEKISLYKRDNDDEVKYVNQQVQAYTYVCMYLCMWYFSLKRTLRTNGPKTYVF